jgi:hypothetical protein
MPVVPPRKPTPKNDGTSGVVVLAIGVAAFVGFLYVNGQVDLEFLSDTTITDYPIHCSGEVNDADVSHGGCSSDWYRDPPTTYTINKDQQYVVGQSPGWPPNRYKDCAIVDRTNWKCTRSTEAGPFEFGYTDGKYFQHWTDPRMTFPTGSVRHVTKAVWFNTKVEPKDK